jgi:diguanylate cyclase (GGDEF)-like protein/PAS domain S-box-containing protein
MFRLALERAPHPMILVNGEGTIVLANQAARQLFGYEAEELTGRHVDTLVPSVLRPAHRQLRDSFMARPEPRPMGVNRDLQAVRRDGSVILVEIGLSPFNTSEGLMVICSIVDISGRKRTEMRLLKETELLERRKDELLEAVETDSLTSLKSRQAFLDHLTGQLEVAIRHARPLSVLLLDIDDFKGYNDVFGHLAGDEVLEQFGRVLKEVARRSDYVARIGGEEIGIVLPETDRAGAIVLGERFRAAIEAANWPRRPITASIGAMTVDFDEAVPRPEAPELSMILREADRALYRSKESGRNRVTHVAEM